MGIQYEKNAVVITEAPAMNYFGRLSSVRRRFPSKIFYEKTFCSENLLPEDFGEEKLLRLE